MAFAQPSEWGECHSPLLYLITTQSAVSFKDVQFIIEALELLRHNYQERLAQLEDVDENEDAIADLGNDLKFLESLQRNLGKEVDTNQLFLLNRTFDSVLN